VRQESAPRIEPKKEYVSSQKPRLALSPSPNRSKSLNQSQLDSRSGVPVLLFSVLDFLSWQLAHILFSPAAGTDSPYPRRRRTRAGNTQYRHQPMPTEPPAGLLPLSGWCQCLLARIRLAYLSFDDLCRREVHLLESFWIDQYETTNEEYQKFMNATGAAPIVR
jgi:hypothetical protein